MTCIVGIEQDDKVYLGGDSIAIEELVACSLTDPKVFINENVGFGFAGSFRAGQTIKYAFKPPVQPQSKSDIEYLVVDFVDELRSVLKGKGILKKDNDVEEVDMQCLIAYRGKLYWMDDDMQIGRSDDGYTAIGRGSEFALGALYVVQMHEPGLSPEEKLVRALSAAERHCVGVRSPFTVVCVENKAVNVSSTRKKKNLPLLSE
jgi:ATP-dependent protease HslVU (ClpYQ) peptidase subunit